MIRARACSSYFSSQEIPSGSLRMSRSEGAKAGVSDAPEGYQKLPSNANGLDTKLRRNKVLLRAEPNSASSRQSFSTRARSNASESADRIATVRCSSKATRTRGKETPYMDKGKNDQNPTKDSPSVNLNHMHSSDGMHSGVSHPPVCTVKSVGQGLERREAEVPRNDAEHDKARKDQFRREGRTANGGSAKRAIKGAKSK